METISAQAGLGALRRATVIARLHPHERIVLLFFVVLAGMACFRAVPATRSSALLFVPLLIGSVCALESSRSAPWSRVTRQFGSLALVLVAYRSLDLIPLGPTTLGESWIGWDRMLLHGFGLQAAVEMFGPLGQWVLETVYLLLYSMPPVALLLLWMTGNKQHANRLLSVLFAGTCITYLLLPVFGVVSPRFAFPGTDLPHYSVLPREINVWLLDHYDSSTGVFPSGHCAVAYSVAFGLLSAVPRLRWLWGSAFVTATLVYLATVYGRYHYAVDGVASFFLALLAWRLCERYWRENSQ
jgi:membrane-associated phospholipid phosphatase